MLAVRSKFKTPFRRDGITFPAAAWLLCASLTEAQAAEIALIVVEGVESEGDSRLTPLPIANPEVFAPVAETAEEAQATEETPALEETPAPPAKKK